MREDLKRASEQSIKKGVERERKREVEKTTKLLQDSRK